MRNVLYLSVIAGLISGCAGNPKDIKGVNNARNDISHEVQKESNATTPASTVIACRPIYFDFDSAVVKNSSLVTSCANEINKAGANISVKLDGYCDIVGTDEYNKKLGSKRVSAVLESLRSRGISKNVKVVANSYGKSKYQQYLNDKVENNRLNRKVSVTIIKKS